MSRAINELQGIGMTSQRTRERLVQRLREQGIGDNRVLDVFRQLPRHLFVDEALAHRAYEDTALPIGNHQTLSQPYIVARMTELLLEVEPQRVLEVGSGCGFQTAVLAMLVPRVYTIERIAALHQKARCHLETLRLRNIMLHLGDGFAGWPLHAPFDAILVTAAPREIPQPLLQQLADGGRLVIPVGGDDKQMLCTIDRQGSEYRRREIEPVIFVPMLQGTSHR